MVVLVTSRRAAARPCARSGRSTGTRPSAERHQPGHEPEPRVERLRTERLLQREHQRARGPGPRPCASRRPPSRRRRPAEPSRRSPPCRPPSTSCRGRAAARATRRTRRRARTPAGRARSRRCPPAPANAPVDAGTGGLGGRVASRDVPPTDTPGRERRPHRRDLAAGSTAGPADTTAARRSRSRPARRVSGAPRRPRPTAVISRHPIVSASLSSRYSTWPRPVDRRRRTPPRSGGSSSPPWPARSAHRPSRTSKRDRLAVDRQREVRERAAAPVRRCPRRPLGRGDGPVAVRVDRRASPGTSGSPPCRPRSPPGSRRARRGCRCRG